MLLRVIIGLGLLLVLGGFGAAGWQYFQSLPQAAAAVMAADEASEPEAAPQQSWLISPTGGLVSRDDADTYLVQDRYVETRLVRITRTAPLSDLLAEGEKLPDLPYLQVLSDIRAPKVAEGFCAVLIQALAETCAVQAARVIEGSVDPATGTARFRVDLVYRLKPAPADLPDLASHVLMTGPVDLAVEPGSEATASPESLLRAVIGAVAEACVAGEAPESCRVMRLGLDWPGDGTGSAWAEIGWLAPLPKGMYPVAPLP